MLPALLVLAQGSVTVRAEEDPGTAARPFALVNQSSLDAAVVARVRDWAQTQLSVKVVIQEADKAQGSLEEQIRSLGEAIPPGIWGVILFVDSQGEDAVHGVVLAKERVAGVNVAALRVDDPDAETLARRLERCLVRNLAFMLEVPPAPDPFCATRPYRSLEDLDRMGRNFSPPTLQDFQRRAHAAGAALLDSPLLMIDVPPAAPLPPPTLEN